MKCEECIFFEAVERWGVCRKNAPRPSSGDSANTTWPKVKADDWCGEFEMAEGRVLKGNKFPELLPNKSGYRHEHP